MLGLNDAGGGGKDAVRGGASVGILVDAELEKTVQKLRPQDVNLGIGRNLFDVLAGQLGHGIADLVADRLVAFRQQGLQNFLADGDGLLLLNNEKGVHVLSLAVLALLRRYAPEEDGGKGPYLS
jgi:hypothetical protein